MISPLFGWLTSLQVANNLERVGDLTKNIAKINKKLTTPLPGDIATTLQKMSQMALSILQEAIAAYNNSDEASWQQVFEGRSFGPLICVIKRGQKAENNEEIDL